MNRDQIFIGVKEALGQVLDMEPGSIRWEDRIIEDLGADSLDLLDLIFHLEQHFKVKIKPGEIERRARERLGGVELEVDGLYTDEALQGLRMAMPEVPSGELAEGIGSADLPRIFRVETFVNLVALLLWEQKGMTPTGFEHYPDLER
jgi:acyl carrier protein